MSDRERYRQELDELEGGNAGRSNVVVPFDREDRAEAFARYLKETLGIETTPRYVSNTSVNTATSSSQWDMDIPGAQLFRVKLLYTLFQKGIRLDAIPSKPMATKQGYLIDRLIGAAILRGSWSDHLCTRADMEWYCDVATIDRKDIPAMVAKAKADFLAMRASEKKYSVVIGVGLMVVGIGLLATGNGMVGWGLLATGAVFVAFSFTR